MLPHEPRVVHDATGEAIAVPAGGARRVVSLVPSETETIAVLAGVERLVGRTEYCVEPRGVIEGVPTVGGTKDASVERIVALAPDLVLANREENTRAIVEGLRARGLTVHVSFPTNVDEGAALCDDLATLLGLDPSRCAPLGAMREQLESLAATRARRAPRRVFCPIWMEPLMTIHGATFISDALDLAGLQNVFADRPRRYPLAADLGLAPSLPPDRLGDRDTRYPRVSLDELRTRAPEVVLLPDEPHPFGRDEREFFLRLDLPASRRGAVFLCSGRDLCWYSPRMGEGIARIAALLA